MNEQPHASLQDALYEPALEYYTNHSKRVRRKRNRHSQASSYQIPISPLATTGVARPLRPEGWTVRYEYKMACFAEFRSEDQVALKYGCVFSQVDRVLIPKQTLSRCILDTHGNVWLNCNSATPNEAMGRSQSACRLHYRKGICVVCRLPIHLKMAHPMVDA